MRRLMASCCLVGLVALSMSATVEATHKNSRSDLLTTAAQNGQFQTLVSLVVAAGLDGDLRGKGPFTVFAPTDEAFAKLPKGTLQTLLKPENREQLRSILLYHVVPQSINVPKRNHGSRLKSAKTLQGQPVQFTRKGTQVRVNDSKIVLRNVRASNGTVQVIDQVLLPPTKKSIVTTAKEAGTFNTLLAAAKAAGLVEALSDSDQLTVFAPTDEAFAKLPKGTVENLLKPENRDQLRAILSYHVIAGKALTARKLLSSDSRKTLQGSNVRISLTGGRLTVNESTVVANDIDGGNGVIHVIDAVLIPGSSRSGHSASARSRH